MEHRKKEDEKQEPITIQKEHTVTLVSTVEQLCLLGEPPFEYSFELTDAFTDPICLPVIDLSSHLRAVISALKSSKAVPSVTFVPHQWKRFELKMLEESLSVNQSVKELMFQNFGMSTAFMETIVRILKKNKTIKKLRFDISPIPIDPWSRFCEGLRDYNIEEISLCTPELQYSHITAFSGTILLNRRIRSIIIEREWSPGDNVIELLCIVIASHSEIERFELISVPSINFQDLNKVINANSLKVLSLKQCFCSDQNLQTMSTALKQNTSITDLNLQTNRMKNFVELGAILQENRSITKLNLSHSNSITDDSVEYLKLKDNKTLIDLDVSECKNLSVPNLLRDLEHNTTLKILRIGNNGQLQYSTLEHFLCNNTTLQELIISKHQYDHVMPVYAMALTGALKINKSLRRLVVPFEGIIWADLQRFLDALKVNTTLTYLSIGQFNQSRAFSDNIEGMTDEELLVNLLKANQTLRHIEGAETSKNMLQGLKRNREVQNKNISDTCILIKMILMKPSSFILPIEVWANIFKHVSYSFTPFDFEKYFNDSMM